MLIMARVCTFNVHLYLTFFCISLLLFPHSDVLVTASSPDLSSLQRSLAEKVQMNQTPETRTFFLNLNVRRTHLVEDSINEVCVAIQHCIDDGVCHARPNLISLAIKMACGKRVAL